MTPQPSDPDRYTGPVKVTRYLERVDLDEADVLLLYSGLSGQMVEVPASYRTQVEALLIAPNLGSSDGDVHLRSMLRDQGILIPESWDEVALLENRMHRARFTPAPHLALTICPTINCNFRCTYCYQHHLPSVMSEGVQDRVIAFIETRSPEVTTLYVTWFGGEPLLALPAIRRLSRLFMGRFSDEKRYRASAITNGWNLRPEVSSELCDLRISRVQVTLDGSRMDHDARRVRAGGGPTFDRIVENLAAADPRLQVTIRVNVDERNAGRANLLFDQLDAAGLQSRVSVYFAPVVAYTEVCADAASTCMAGYTWSSLQARLQFEAYMRGYGGPALPASRSNVCIADNVNGWVIRPDGLVFKCWSDVTQPHRAVLNLRTGEQTSQMAAVLETWNNWDPFRLSGCRSCKILPQCLGGCGYLAMRQREETGCEHGHCDELKYNLKETLATYYLAHKRHQAADLLMKGLHQWMPDTAPDLVCEEA